MANNNLPNPLRKIIMAIRRYRTRLPLKISQKALLEIKTNFARGGYDSPTGFVRWAPRKDKKRKNALLIKTGRLRRSLKAAPEGNDPRVITDVPYAQALNDGFEGTQNVRGHTRRASKKVSVRSASGRSRKKKVAGRSYSVRAFSRRMKLPARPFMVTGPKFLDEMEKMVMDDLEKIFTNT